MPQGLRVRDASGVEILSVTSSLVRIIHDQTAIYNRAPGGRYSGSVTNIGLKTGEAWWYIYDVRYFEDEAGDETGLYDVQVTFDRVNGVLSWNASSQDGDVTTHEIRVLCGVR